MTVQTLIKHLQTLPKRSQVKVTYTRWGRDGDIDYFKGTLVFVDGELHWVSR